MDNELVSSAMEIILHAGDARTQGKEALEAGASFDLTVAHERMAEAHSEITRAHRVQTDAIQGEARGEELPYSLLFTHAQDTLMTINSEIVLAKQIISVFEAYDARLNALENKLGS